MRRQASYTDVPSGIVSALDNLSLFTVLSADVGGESGVAGFLSDPLLPFSDGTCFFTEAADPFL
jgi:hypothetical protein